MDEKKKKMKIPELGHKDLASINILKGQKWAENTILLLKTHTQKQNYKNNLN